MTLGAGLVWATLLALIALTIWRTTVNQKWKLVGKAVLGIVVAAAIIGAGLWGWNKYQNRPRLVTELAGVKLGMTPVEVTLALGEPKTKSDPGRDTKGKESFGYVYRKEYDSNYVLFVRFENASGRAGVTLVCEQDGYSSLLGLSRFSKEADVVEKLGPPDNTSIQANGLEKMISYSKWNASYQIAKGEVTAVCVSSSGGVTFTEEYKQEPVTKP